MNSKLIFITVYTLLLFTTCNQNTDLPIETVDPIVIDYSYHSHIISPSEEEKEIDEYIEIEVDFESHTGETVHDINVKIYNKLDTSIIYYNEPTLTSINEKDGIYTYENYFQFTEENGFTEPVDVVLEASVWGEEGVGLVTAQIEFHVSE